MTKVARLLPCLRRHLDGEGRPYSTIELIAETDDLHVDEVRRLVEDVLAGTTDRRRQRRLQQLRTTLRRK